MDINDQIRKAHATIKEEILNSRKSLIFIEIKKIKKEILNSLLNLKGEEFSITLTSDYSNPELLEKYLRVEFSDIFNINLELKGFGVLWFSIKT